MLRRAREFGPVALIPAAWGFVAATHAGVVAESTLLIAHVVMTTLLVVFAVTGRADMREGTLRVWWLVITAGIPVTAAGLAGLHFGVALLQGVALFGWMLLPVAGFLDTGRRATQRPWVYYGAAGGCVAGAVVAAVGLFTASVPVTAGLVLVGAGQTAAIADAAFGY
jgi:hypothetical protein